jgi:5-methyltetrahydropteroyltriglutamate--homocysteine methyltransferase
VGDVREALKYIPAENLILSTDCGFGRQGLNRLVAFHKAAALAQAATIIKGEL